MTRSGSFGDNVVRHYAAVDTHGCTHSGSEPAKVLGFDLYTRWHDMRGQWLHVPRVWPDVPGREPVLKRDLEPNFIAPSLTISCVGPPRSMMASDRRHACLSATARRRVARRHIVPERSGGNGGIRCICAPTLRSHRFAAASTDYWSGANPCTNSSGSFTPDRFGMIAVDGGTRKS